MYQWMSDLCQTHHRRGSSRRDRSPHRCSPSSRSKALSGRSGTRSAREPHTSHSLCDSDDICGPLRPQNNPADSDLHTSCEEDKNKSSINLFDNEENNKT